LKTLTPLQVVAGDFTNNGEDDLAVGTDTGVLIFLANPDRTFQPPITVTTKAPPVALATGEFNNDGHLDLAVLEGTTLGNVEVFLGDGKGNFKQQGVYAAGDNPSAIAVGDLNRDGFQDILVANQTTPGFGTAGNDYITTLLNQNGIGFVSMPPLTTAVLDQTSAPIQSISLVDLNHDLYPDLVGSFGNGTVNSGFAMLGFGDGTFLAPDFFAADGGGAIGPSLLAVGSDPYIRATTFNVTGNFVSSNLFANGGFDTLDLAGEKGNLTAWNSAAEAGSHGQWQTQTSIFSPLSSVTVDAPPQGTYAAMLDEPNLVPPVTDFAGIAYFAGPTEQASDYDGAHVFYQDIFIPASVTQVNFSMSLYINNNDPLNQTGYSDPLITPQLDYFPGGSQNRPKNQQVRVDFMDPNASLFDVGSGVLLNLFQSNPQTPLVVHYQTLTADLTQFTGKHIRLRIAEVNNQGKLVIGVDNVQAQAFFTNSQQPTLQGLHLRNPGFGATATFGGNTTDPTIVGKVTATGTPTNLNYIEVDPIDNTFKAGDTYFITAAAAGWDALGNFQTTLPDVLPNGQSLLPGIHTVYFRAVDKAGVISAIQSFMFNFQGPTITGFQAQGPGPLRFAGTGVNYPTVSGKITAIAVDPRDPSGNTFYVGSDNGGIWKTLDGGNDWTPLTDYLVDPTIGYIPLSIGSIAIDPNAPDNVYAVTGVADNAQASRPSVGILKSTNSGSTWTLIGNDTFNGARVSSVSVSPQSTVDGKIRVYVTVDAGGSQGPGVYRSEDGGKTWTNVLTQTSMNLDAGGHPGTGPGSVTSLAIDQYNPENIWIGIGNVNLVANNATAGVWFSNNHGDSWQQILGGHDPKNAVASVRNQTIPSGATVGKVTVALPSGTKANEGIVYIMMGTVGTGFILLDGTSFNPGTESLANRSIGVFKTRNGGLSWTHVMLAEDNPDEAGEGTAQHFENLFTLGQESNEVGALAVDPNNAAVFYIGGGTRFNNGTDPQENFHGFLRVDTSNMRDTEYLSPFYPTPVYPNDGDDIVKAADAAEQVAPPTEPGNYFTGAVRKGGYSGEGVFWYDLQTTDFGQENNFLGGMGSQPFNPQLLLPATIHALVFDGQGRLLVGTEGGLWRGVSQGFTYDITSAGTGIAAQLGDPTPNEGGMNFTDLNGNLQIADVTSVAVDPYQRNTYDDTMTSLGWARTTGGLQWDANPSFSVSSTFSGLFDGFAFDAPFAGPVVAGPRNPNAPAGTQANIYRTMSLVLLINLVQNGVPAQVEVSHDGGLIGTFQSAVQGLALSDIKTSVFLPLAVGPQLQPDQNGNLHDELLYWTNKIFETDTGAASWDPTSPVLPSGSDTVTAMSIGAGGTDAFYIGTQQGQVYIDLHNGGDGFPNRSSGLPGRRVNDIVGDPTNPLVAYVMLDGYNTGGGHVFQTTDGGQSWHDISQSLPDVPAYAMAIDPGNFPGAKGQTLYVGTGLGVYFATAVNGVVSDWTRLGVIKNADGTTTSTLPNVAATDVQYNADYRQLVVATLGRGVFKISTNTNGPRVTAISPNTPVSPGLSSVTVTFNEPVDPRSFTTGSVNLIQGPGGPITPLSVRDLDPINHLSYQINFLPQLADGVYTVSIGPNILDFQGNTMDQNQNGINGESPGDIYVATFAVNSTDNGHFITGVYHDLLSRTADTGGFLGFLSSIDSARFAQLPATALSFVTSDEARGDTIFNSINNTGLYESLLRRTASASEVNYWLGQLKQGIPPEQIIAALAGSDEYYTQAAVGGTDQGFLNQLYPDVLGRGIDTAGQIYFTGLLSQAEQQARVSSANLIDHSPEYYSNLVFNASTNTGYYETYLRRAANSGEESFWINQLQSGMTDETMIASLVGSPEYYNDPKVITTDVPNGTDGTDATWVKAIFNDLLNRSVTSSEAMYFQGELSNGKSRLAVALEILGTTEYKTNLVNSFYQKYLGRSADQGGLSYFVNALKNGLTDEAMITALVSSAEYFAKQSPAGSTQGTMDTNWIGGAYKSILGRAADAGGISYFNGALHQAESSTRLNIVFTIDTSLEYVKHVIRSDFETYLKREPGVADYAYWVPFFGNPGKPVAAGAPNNDERFLASVLGSGEYFYLQRDPNALATTTQWLLSLYTNLLARTPPTTDAGFLANLNGILNGYVNQRTAVATTIESSNEYRTDVVISLYKTYLRRSPSPSEIATQVAFLASGGTDEQLIGALVSSNEYFNNPGIGAKDNSIWLNQAYKDLLGRDRDPSSQPFLDGLNNGTLTRLQVSTDIVNSTEYRGRLIADLYSTYLNRKPTSNEESYWENQIQMNGVTDEGIIAVLLGSNEYFQESHLFP
jgi:hypothetical protein